MNWKKRPFLDKMIDDGVSGPKCLDWCIENGFQLSVKTMYKYINLRKQANAAGISMEELMGLSDEERGKLKKPRTARTRGPKPDPKRPKRPREKEREDRAKAEARRKKAQEEREKRAKANGSTAPNLKRTEGHENRQSRNLSVNKVKSDMELLDEVIQKGMETLDKMEAISPNTAIKAIEMKHKITGGKHQGFTTYGLEEIRLREKARENAMLVVMLEFIPEEKHEEVIDRMEETTKEYYESLGLGDAYARALHEDEGAEEVAT